MSSSRPTYSNEDLAAEVSLVPQLVNNSDVPEKSRTATEDIIKRRALLDDWQRRGEVIAEKEENEKAEDDKKQSYPPLDGGNHQ